MSPHDPHDPISGDSVGPFEVVAFAGSLRVGSFNRALLRAAVQEAPEEMRIRIVEIGAMPFYNADVEAVGDPPAVAAFKEEIRRADGVLIATPEYNDGIPGVLMNALDWASRLPGRSPLVGKPAAIVGASGGQVGTARAQSHLRQVLDHVHARVLPSPELLIGRAHDKFDAQLQLTDEPTRRILAMLLRRFDRWIRRELAADEAERALVAMA